MNAFLMEAFAWLPYIYYRKMMQAHQEFIGDLIHV